MTNLALEGVACSTYSLYDANKDAAQLHKLSCKATLATAMIDQEIAEIEKDLQVLEARKKEILEPLEDEMERLKGNLIEYHRREVETGGDKTIKLPWAQANAPEFVKVPAPTVVWGDLKKAVVVAGSKVLLKETGEVVEGLTTKERAVKFDVEVL